MPGPRRCAVPSRLPPHARANWRADEVGNPDETDHLLAMDDDAFDHALIGAWFALAADDGRRLPSVAAAAREAGLPLDRARARFASRASVLMRFGRFADQAALATVPADGS